MSQCRAQFSENKTNNSTPSPLLSIIIFIPPLLEFSLELFLKKPFFDYCEKKTKLVLIYIGVIFLFLIFKKITNLIHFPLLKSWLYSAVDDISRFSNFAIKFCEEIKNYQDKNPPPYNSIVLLLLL